jgi:hypothetical protein
MNDETVEPLMEKPVKLVEAKPLGPCAFLCHASEDKPLAQQIARDFQASGIDTFFDEWEIGPGDSLRAKIDAGLGRCTHFVVLLTPRSLPKPWVNAEMDAGFVRKVNDRCRFIALRHELSADRLPPLLQPLHSPQLIDYDRDMRQLINDIHGVTRKPPLGEPPATVRRRSEHPLSLSPAAEQIVRLMIEQSEHGYAMDPQLSPDQLRAATGLSDDDIVDAVDELRGRGLVRPHCAIGDGAIGFHVLTPEAALFVAFDQHFVPWNPEADALRVAADLANGAVEGGVQEIARKYGWPPRRMNPAISYLIERRLVDSGNGCGSHPWCTRWIGKNHATRRFVRDRS